MIRNLLPKTAERFKYQKLRIAAFASVFVVVAVAGGVFWNINRSRILESQTRPTPSQQSITISAASQSSAPSSENQIAAISSQTQSKAVSSVSHAKTASSKPVSKASTCRNQTSSGKQSSTSSSGDNNVVGVNDLLHFTFNNRTYWQKPCPTIPPELPSNYKLAGTLPAKGRETTAAVGDPIYMDPSNQDAVYLQLASDHYELYVTQKIQGCYINYNGTVYSAHTPDIYQLPSDFTCVGSITSVDYTRIPSESFEANFVDSLGLKIYANAARPATIYAQNKKGVFYMLAKK